MFFEAQPVTKTVDTVDKSKVFHNIHRFVHSPCVNMDFVEKIEILKIGKDRAGLKIDFSRCFTGRAADGS